MFRKGKLSFFHISIMFTWIVIFISFKNSESLTLKYGFEHQPHGYCHNFPFKRSDRHIILKTTNGTEIWNQINFGNNTKLIKPHFYLNSSFINNELRLCFRNLSRKDKGNYTLEETKSKRMFNFSIDVYYAAKIQSTDGEKSIKQSQDVSLKCEVDSNPQANITWILPQNETDYRGQSEENNSTLSITNCTCEQTGYYTCLASNKKNRYDEEKIFLDVTCGPIFENKHNYHEAEIYLKIGENLEYSINFTANPTATIMLDTDLYFSINSLGAVHHTIFIQKFILHAKDFKKYTIKFLNKIGVAKLALYVLQQNIDKSDKKKKWYIVGFIPVSIIVSTSLLLCVIYVWKKKKKTKKTVYDGSYRDNCLYEPTPVEFLTRSQQQTSQETISNRGNASGESRITLSEQISEEKNNKIVNTTDKPFTDDTCFRHRRKPVPIPRSKRNKLNTEIASAPCLNISRQENTTGINNHTCLPEGASKGKGGTQPKGFEFADYSELADRQFRECQDLETSFSCKDENFDDIVSLHENISTTKIKRDGLSKGNKNVKPLNYVEVENPIKMISPVIIHGSKQKSNYHIVLNGNGVIVPFDSENSEHVVEDSADQRLEDDFPAKSQRDNCMEHFSNGIENCYFHENENFINKQELKPVYSDNGNDCHFRTLNDVGYHGYIYRWFIKKNSNNDTSCPVRNTDDSSGSDNEYVNCVT